MSSPIALKDKDALKQSVNSLHQKLSHSTRINILGSEIAEFIEELSNLETINCLDIGCGDMGLAELIQNLNPKTDWKCIDIHPLPEEKKNDERWHKYTSFDGKHIPFEDDKFEVALFCDVLHHDMPNLEQLLKEASRVSRIVIINDL